MAGREVPDVVIMVGEIIQRGLDQLLAPHNYHQYLLDPSGTSKAREQVLLEAQPVDMEVGRQGDLVEVSMRVSRISHWRGSSVYHELVVKWFVLSFEGCPEYVGFVPDSQGAYAALTVPMPVFRTRRMIVSVLCQ